MEKQLGARVLRPITAKSNSFNWEPTNVIITGM